MRRIRPAGLLLLLFAAPAIAQPPTVGPGDIRCPDCALSGQKPATAPFDPSQIELVANPAPAFFENQTIRFSVIARVLQPAPLILDVLDSRVQTLDRNMRWSQPVRDPAMTPRPAWPWIPISPSISRRRRSSRRCS